MRVDLTRSGQMPIADLGLSNISKTVRSVRREHGMTQSELAGLSGTGLRFVSELERGKPTVSLNKVLAVLAVLGVAILLSNKNK